MRAEHLPYRLPYFLSPVGSLGGFAGCSSISSPFTLLEQQELPRRRPGSTHREAPINLGELDKLCTVPRPLRKTDVWKGKPWEAEKDPEGSPGQEQSSVQAAGGGSSPGKQLHLTLATTVLHQSCHHAPPAMEPLESAFGSLQDTSQRLPGQAAEDTGEAMLSRPARPTSC